jgi:hypothetical protein
MFLPMQGAALQVLKVEIGGGAFTSDGAEASHMYTADDNSTVRFNRGYGARFPTKVFHKCTLEDAIEFHAFAPFEALACS